MAKLQYVYNGQAYEIVVLPQGLRVGAAGDAGLSLVTPQMAPYHFTIFQRGGVFSVQDMGSPSGTFVNGQRLSNHPAPLPSGAVLQAGGIQFNFFGDGPQPAPPMMQAPPQVAPTPPPAPAPAAPVAPRGRRPAGSNRGGRPRRGPSQPQRQTPQQQAPQQQMPQRQAPRQQAPQQPMPASARPSAPQQQQQAPRGSGPVSQAPAAIQTFSGPPSLHFLDESGRAAQSYTVHQKLTVGRYAENDLTFEDDLISGEHCLFEYNDGVLLLTDLESSNFTWVNTERLTGSRTLKQGDIITLALVARFAVGDPNAMLARQARGGQVLPEMKRHIGMRTPMQQAPSWTVGIIISMVVFILAAAGGFFIPRAMFPEPKGPELATADWGKSPVLSFEESGAHGGWELTAKTDQVYAAIDKLQRRDGDAALVMTVPSGGRVSLMTASEVSFDLSKSGELTVSMRGSSMPSARVTVSALSEGRSVVLGSAELNTLSSSSWQDIKVALKAPKPLASAKLALEFSGGFSSLWVDRVRISPTEGGAANNGGGSAQDSGVLLSAGDDREIVAVNPQTSVAATLTPLALSIDRRKVEGAWSQTSQGEGLKGAWSIQSEGLPLTVSREPQPAKRLIAGDLNSASAPSINWRISKGTLALAIELTLNGEGLSFFDTFGNEIPVLKTSDQGVGPVYALGTDSLLIVFGQGNMGVKIVSFEAKVGASLLVTSLTAPPPETLDISVFSSSPLKAATWQGVADDMESQFDNGRYSAALERAKVLKNVKGDAYAALRTQAESIIQRVAVERERLVSRLERMMTTAHSDEATLALVEIALETCSAIKSAFQGDSEANKRAEEARDELENLRADLQFASALRGSGLRPSRPREPKDERNRLLAIEAAAKLLTAAKQAHSDGNWLLAHLMADNTAWNYSFTPSGNEAATLQKQIEADWRNYPERSAFCRPLLRHAETEVYLGGSREKIEELVRKVIARYPKNEEADQARRILAQLAGN